MENTNQFLGTKRVGKLMRRYAVPCIISLLVGALYNIVDQIFIANASYLGSYGNAANTVVFPLTVVALALAVAIGGGRCGILCRPAGGAGDRRQFRRMKIFENNSCICKWGVIFYHGYKRAVLCRAPGNHAAAARKTRV